MIAVIPASAVVPTSTLIDVLSTALVVIGVPVLILGFVRLLHHPLALWFDVRDRRLRRAEARGPSLPPWEPSVTVVVPAFDEGRVLRACVESVLADRYPRLEVVLVDDGSTDDTWEVMQRFASDPRVRLVRQANAGKAAALNAGIAVADGEILVLCDADGIFGGDTIAELLGGFDDASVGAVCGNDEPVNLDGLQPRLLALLTHATSMVRRALSLIGCLTIVSGNIGAFRASVVREIGGFRAGLVGEDLELTWRVHRAGYRVRFRPRALVYAEVPATVRSLFVQRVRWTRGLIQTARIHRDMLLRPRFGRIGAFLPYDLTVMLALPVLQVVSLALLGALALAGAPLPGPAVLVGALIGFGLAILEILFVVALDRAWRDLRLLVVLPAWPLFSALMTAVVLWSIVLEVRGGPAGWNKFARTGVVSRSELLAGSRGADDR